MATQFPLLLFLHGRGECGNDLTQINRHGPPRLAGQPGRPAFLEPFIIVAPQCPAGESWSVAPLAMLLEQALQHWRIDSHCVYLTGISMGGYGVWRWALAQPERFAALIPICGGGDPAQAERLREMPIWMLHSAQDEVVPVTESDRMFAALQNCDAPVTYTRYRGLDHVQTWEMAYAESMLYVWLLRQRLR